MYRLIVIRALFTRISDNHAVRPPRRHNLSRNAELRVKVGLSVGPKYYEQRRSAASTQAFTLCAALRVPRVADMAVGPTSSTPERRLPSLAWCAR